MRVIIIEDEPAVRKDITGILKLRPDIQILGEAATVNTAIKLINTTEPDVILLDIHLGDGNAFELLSSISTYDFQIIFITAYDNFAIKAIKVGAFDYLLKPVDSDELFSSLDKIIKQKNNLITTKEQVQYTTYQTSQSIQSKPNKFIIKTNEGIHIIVYKDILYCKGEGSYTYFYLSDNREILASKPLKEYEDLLPSDEFVRCHQSYIVNINELIKIDRDDNLILKNGHHVPVATRRKDVVLKVLSQ